MTRLRINRVSGIFIQLLFVVLFSGIALARTNPEMHFPRAMEAFAKGDYKGAVMDLNAVVWYCVEEKLHNGWTMEPRDYELGAMGYLYRGISHSKLNQSGLAVSDFQNAEKWAGDMPEVQMNIATEFYKIGRYDEAIRLYGKVLEKEPEKGLAHYFIGFPYMKKKDYERAWFHALKAKELGVKQTGLIDKLQSISPRQKGK